MIIGLLGQKGAGKDTAGAVLAKELNGTCIAFADPMKRFCKNAFGLTERQLWGNAKEKPISKRQLLCKLAEPPTTEPAVFGSLTRSAPLRWMHALDLACCSPIGLSVRAAMTNPRYSADQAMGAWWTALSKRKGITPRVILQTFGTEVGRQQLGDDIWIRQGLVTARKVLDGWAYDRVQGLAKRHGGSDAAIITDVRFRNEVLEIKRAGGKIYRVNRPSQAISGGHKGAHSSEAEQLGIPDWWCDGVLINDGTRVQFEADVAETSRYIRTTYYGG